MAATGWIGSRVFQAVYIWVCLQGYCHNLPDEFSYDTALPTMIFEFITYFKI